MNLKQYTALKPLFLQGMVSLYHGQLNYIGCSTLNRSIHSHSLSQHALIEIAASDGRQITPPVEHSSNVTLIMHIRYCFIDKGLYPRAFSKITLNVTSSFNAGNLQVLRKAIVTHTIYNTEINSFCTAAHCWCYFLNRNIKHLSGCASMYILSIIKGLDKALISRHGCQ